MTNLDRGALATYCGAYAMWAEAMEQIQKYGTVVKSQTGFPIQSPYLAIANQQAEIMMRIASAFGFTHETRTILPDVRVRNCADRPHQPEASRQADHSEGAPARRERCRSDGGTAQERRRLLNLFSRWFWIPLNRTSLLDVFPWRRSPHTLRITKEAGLL
jgi:P27 family predicted phage terminase small subunit